MYGGEAMGGAGAPPLPGEAGYGAGAGAPPLPGAPGPGRGLTIVRQSSQALGRTASSGSPGILRGISARISEAVGTGDRTFLCPICFENLRTTTHAFALTGCMEHLVCKGCAKEYVSNYLKTGGRIDAMTCPGGDECGCVVAEEDVVRLCGDTGELTGEYRRFAAKQSEAGASDCPDCGTTVRRTPDDPRDPILTCTKCDRRFCFFHSAAHGPDESCEEYRRRTAKAEETFKKSQSGVCAFCPKCGVATVRVSGCNHITCASCKENYCYLCLQTFPYSKSEDHFGTFNPYGCPGLQFAPLPPGCRVFDEAGVQRAQNCMACMRITRLVLLPILVILAIPVCIGTFALGMATMFACIPLIIIFSLLLLPFAMCFGWEMENVTDQLVETLVSIPLTIIFFGISFAQFTFSGPESFSNGLPTTTANAPRPTPPDVAARAAADDDSIES